jgi:hypothetical protein
MSTHEEILGYFVDVLFKTAEREIGYLTVAERNELIGRQDTAATSCLPLVRTRAIGDGLCWLVQRKDDPDSDFITSDRRAMYGYLEQGLTVTTLTYAHIDPKEHE